MATSELCFGGLPTITFERISMIVVTFTDEHRKLKHKLLFAIKIKQILRESCEGFLAHVIVEEGNLIRLKDIHS